MSRQTARAVLPPLFALALVAVVTRPIDAPLPLPPTVTTLSTHVGTVQTTSMSGVSSPATASR